MTKRWGSEGARGDWARGENEGIERRRDFETERK
jgi:hypothetical protein